MDGDANLGNEVRLFLISDNTKKILGISCIRSGLSLRYFHARYSSSVCVCVCDCICIHKLENCPSGLTFVIHIPIDFGIYVPA